MKNFAKAAGMSISAYIKWRVLAADMPKPKSRGKAPIKDFTALGNILGELGQSKIALNLTLLAEAAKSGSLPVTLETEAELLRATAVIL
ncbi:MAG: hypothetical protein HRU28_08085 [Rhizobiales bacterium]|nr:hypothetical protein [Hyphomicrobiales bacterium]